MTGRNPGVKKFLVTSITLNTYAYKEALLNRSFLSSNNKQKASGSVFSKPEKAEFFDFQEAG